MAHLDDLLAVGHRLRLVVGDVVKVVELALLREGKHPGASLPDRRQRAEVLDLGLGACMCGSQRQHVEAHRHLHINPRSPRMTTRKRTTLVGIREIGRCSASARLLLLTRIFSLPLGPCVCVSLAPRAEPSVPLGEGEQSEAAPAAFIKGEAPSQARVRHVASCVLDGDVVSGLASVFGARGHSCTKLPCVAVVSPDDIRSCYRGVSANRKAQIRAARSAGRR